MIILGKQINESSIKTYYKMSVSNNKKKYITKESMMDILNVNTLTPCTFEPNNKILSATYKRVTYIDEINDDINFYIKRDGISVVISLLNNWKGLYISGLCWIIQFNKLNYRFIKFFFNNQKITFIFNTRKLLNDVLQTLCENNYVDVLWWNRIETPQLKNIQINLFCTHYYHLNNLDITFKFTAYANLQKYDKNNYIDIMKQHGVEILYIDSDSLLNKNDLYSFIPCDTGIKLFIDSNHVVIDGYHLHKNHAYDDYIIDQLLEKQNMTLTYLNIWDFYCFIFDVCKDEKVIQITLHEKSLLKYVDKEKGVAKKITIDQIDEMCKLEKYYPTKNIANKINQLKKYVTLQALLSN